MIGVHACAGPTREVRSRFPEQHVTARAYQIPTDDEQPSDNLYPNLSSVSGDSTAWIGDRKCSSAVNGRKDSSEETTEVARDGVCMEDEERIVDVCEGPDALADIVKSGPGDGSAKDTDDNRSPAGDKTSSGSNGDQSDQNDQRRPWRESNRNPPGNHAIDCTQNGWLAEGDDIQSGPDEQRCGGADECVEDGHTGIERSGIRIASVEASPSTPEDASANHGEQYVAGFGIISILWQPRSQDGGSDKAGGSRGQMNDISSRIIHDAERKKETTSPDGEGDGTVGKRLFGEQTAA